MSRRRFFALGGAAGAFGVGLSLGHRAGARVATPSLASPGHDPFTLGVGSGDPWPGSVVLWTRLVPNPIENAAGGFEQRPYEVEWQVAADSAMGMVERRGTAWAVPELGHSVHVTVDGLDPGRDYWYRFKSGQWLSPIGRTKTAPPAGQAIKRLDLAVASCQRWDAGYYTAHRHLAEDAPDAVVFLGDYIYEVAVPSDDHGRRSDTPIPFHIGVEADSLEAYRARYAWYKRDADLQAAHQAAPWIATWDDHEVQDNYAAAIAGRPATPASFAARRAAAYQAYWEHLPLRIKAPIGGTMSIHRRLAFGDLADLHVLDTRQHRSDQVPGGAWQRTSPDRDDPTRTMLGEQQQRWLADGLAASDATWNVVAQQVIAGRLRVDAGVGDVFNVDTWDGYPAAQQQLHRALSSTTNPVVLTGDLHAGYALDITAPVDDPAGANIAVELATTSISSGGDGSDLSSSGKRLLDANPQLRYASQRRGYLRCRFTPDELTAEFRTVPYVTGSADAPVMTDRTFVVEAGQPTLRAV